MNINTLLSLDAGLCLLLLSMQ